MVHLYKLNGYNIALDVNSGAIHSIDDETYMVIDYLRENVFPDGNFGGSAVKAAEANGFATKTAAELVEEDPLKITAQVKEFFLGKADRDALDPNEQDTLDPNEQDTLDPNEQDTSHSNDNDQRETSVKGISEKDIDEIMEDIFELTLDGQLFSEDVFQPLAQQLKSRQSVLKAMCLHVAHACNMDCEYCFAGKGEYHGEAGLMSYETGKAAIDYLVEHSPGRTNLEVDFFGGEPLLNWEVVKKLVAYGRSIEKEKGKNFRFTITTNGLLLDDEVIEFCNREMSNVVISLDGTKETNDRMRHTKEGGGTYDLIIDRFKNFVRNRKGEYYMRGTYTHNNLDFVKDLCHMADEGFSELSIEPVVAPPEADYALQEGDAPVLCDQYEKLALEMIRRRDNGEGFYFYHYTIDFEGGPCIAKRISGCGVGTEYMAVTPEGDIYPCHQFVGEEDFIMGNIFEGITRPEVKELFTDCNVYSHQECGDCFARLYCSGGCAANAYHSTGSVSGVYQLGCILHKKRIECAIMMKVDEDAKQ